MREQRAGSLEMTPWRSCAVEEGSSTSSMILTVISGSVAMWLISRIAASTTFCFAAVAAALALACVIVRSPKYPSVRLGARGCAPSHNLGPGKHRNERGMTLGTLRDEEETGAITRGDQREHGARILRVPQ